MFKKVVCLLCALVFIVGGGCFDRDKDRERRRPRKVTPLEQQDQQDEQVGHEQEQEQEKYIFARAWNGLYFKWPMKNDILETVCAPGLTVMRGAQSLTCQKEYCDEEKGYVTPASKASVF